MLTTAKEDKTALYLCNWMVAGASASFGHLPAPCQVPEGAGVASLSLLSQGPREPSGTASNQARRADADAEFGGMRETLSRCRN